MALLNSLLHPLRVVLRRLLAAWVELRLIEPAPERLGLDPTRPTLYVLPHPALSDRLLLEIICRRHGLPAPEARWRVGNVTRRGCLALPSHKRRLWRRRSPDAPFGELIDALAEHPDTDVQLVPVSVFWGRAPGKTFGFWKLLAADSWQLTGRLRRALSMLVNARNVELYWGEPLSLRELLDERPAALTRRKVSRVLRVHFRRVRTRVLGPDLSHRRTLIAGLIADREIQRVIDETATAQGLSHARVERRARRYAREIASNTSYPVLRFLDQLLHRLWNRLYAGVRINGLEQVKRLAGDHTLVYVPCHRSHIDYLLLSYVLYREGLMPPHIAAGRNLDMPVVGALLRRGGAFFLRRSFKDNRLYGAVFNEYLHRLLARGHPVEYFIEGGRSRSGRLLAPRPGMLAMTLRSYLRGTQRGVAFVPVYIGYEKVLESASYLRELRGGRKKKESPLDLFRVLGQLRQPFGRVQVNVGEPLELDDFLDAAAPHWRDSRHETRPAWLSRTVPLLGRELGQRINAAAALNPVNLTALVLLATPHRAIEADLLEHQMTLLVALQRSQPGGSRVSLPEGSPREWLAEAQWLGFVERRSQALGELVLIDGERATLLTWYRNNVQHLFALPALVAFAFRNNAQNDLETLDQRLAPAWPLIAQEQYVRLPGADFRQALQATLATLVDHGLLERTAQGWQRPPGHSLANQQLQLLGRLVQPTLERGYLLLAALLRQPSASLTRDALEERSRQLAERLTLLSGLNAPEFFDRRLFSSLLDSLEAEGWVWESDGRLAFDDLLGEALKRSRSLFDPELRHRLLQIARPAGPAASDDEAPSRAAAHQATD
ncbi:MULTISPECIES: glycerol-3-phosphate 1-O-acyltransferase PlsB [unclassified Modicisalibacter]|uniref:glycerol-3-phosphate 1-O-acyltransferase PlsB n=1 Tax=unclassified Modicisalibacter TaxID=2679913 RepID=UPI001CC95A26|nr:MULTISPECIES: glycerol-3-phosphate 1-O-acyltransferase PlsB [unclassified Modicisalibacter]MBZ9559257.1 glycerol-3-phosphate 1-O-acyltransferase PlsB [Modicisalibacter sp. R2A 31.J]MBZ9576578.1 glycerol-3-phosphate 1-O-acyltransferase PlsB [Modicisalibacter sp. MOD 31.J]